MIDKRLADEMSSRILQYIEKLEEASREKGELVEALEELVRVNEEWNSAVEQVIGRPAGWNADYLNKAKALLNRLKESNVKK